MVLDRLDIGAPWQPQALNEDTRRLSYMMLLPLADGVFATMLVSGYLKSFSSMLNVAFTIFAGAGALTVIYSEAETAQEARKMILKISPMLIAGSILTGMVAPAFESLLYLGRLKIVSGIAVGLIGLQILQVKGADRVPVPALIAAGLLLSLRTGPQLAFTLDYLLPSVLTVSIALAGLYAAAGLGNRINVDYMRKGGALVLLTISASLLGIDIPSGTGLLVLAASIAASLRF
jgi:hypothetical protein